MEDSIPIIVYNVPVFSQSKIDIERIAPLIEEDLKENTCPICFDDLEDAKYVRKTICGHLFCSKCLHEWFQKKQVCPLCQHNFLDSSSAVLDIV